MVLLLVALTAVGVRSAILRESPLKTDTVFLLSHPDRIAQPEDTSRYGSFYSHNPEKAAGNPLAAIERNLYCYSSTTRPRCLTVLEFTDTTFYLTRRSFPDAEHLSYNDGFGRVLQPQLAHLLEGRETNLKEIRLYFSNRIDRSESLWSMLFWPAYVGGAAFVESAITGPISWGRFGLVSFGAWMATTGVMAIFWDPAPTLTITRIQFQAGAPDTSEIPEHEITLLRAREELRPIPSAGTGAPYHPRPPTLPKKRK